MKKIIVLMLFAVIATVGFAQEDYTIMSRLKQKYAYVSYQPSGLGWYCVSYVGDYEAKASQGACDKDGNEVVPCKYDYVMGDNYGFYVDLNEKRGAYDFCGNEIAPCIYDINKYFNLYDEYLEVYLKGEKKVIPITSKMCIIMEDKAVTAKLKEKYSFVCFHDSYGTYSVSSQGDHETKGKQGACDINGNEVVPCKYDNVVYHGYSLCLGVELNGKEEEISCNLSRLTFEKVTKPAR